MIETRNFTAKCIDPANPDPLVLHEVCFDMRSNGCNWVQNRVEVLAQCPMTAIETMIGVFKHD